MKVETKDIYSEVYQLLNLFGDEYIDKIPNGLFNMLKEKRNVDYNPQYTEDMPLNSQNIKNETISIIVLLYLNYWCESEKEKTKLNQMLNNNEETYQEELRIKYNPEDVFKNHNKQGNIMQEQVSLIEYKEPLLKRIINRIKNIFC